LVTQLARRHTGTDGGVAGDARVAATGGSHRVPIERPPFV
jgi:hypothetical protein